MHTSTERRGTLRQLAVDFVIPRVWQCCGSGMFILDRNFFHPGSRIRIFSIKDPGSELKNLRILSQKIVSKLSEIWSGFSSQIRIPNPDQFCGSMKFWNGSGCGSGSAHPYLWPMDPDADPGGQKTYGSYGCGSAALIWILIFYPSRIPDPEAKKAPDSGSATLL